MEQYDIVIIGAGPAGLSLARELASQQYSILILDKKKNAADVQYNTSGSFLDKKEWEIPDFCFHPITATYFASKNQNIAKRGVANIINRKKLLTFLEKEARKNQNFRVLYEAAVIDSAIGSNGVESIVYIKEKKKYAATGKVFVDCSGVSAILGRKFGLAPADCLKAVGCEYLVPMKTEPNTADLFVGSNFYGGYGWIFPLDNKTAIVGWGSLLQETFPHVEEYLKNMWKIPRVAERCAFTVQKKYVAVFRTGKPLKLFHKQNLIILGDTALQGNPLVGEGIRFVMDASRIAASAIEKTLQNNDLSLLKEYTLAWKKKYYNSFLLAYHLQKRIMNASQDDRKMDFGVKRLGEISDADFTRLLSADLSWFFLLKIGGISMIKMLF